MPLLSSMTLSSSIDLDQTATSEDPNTPHLKCETSISVAGKTHDRVQEIPKNPFPTNVDYIDDKTKLIINGYIQNAKKLLNKSFFKEIPLEINQITLYFVDDHFMINRGSFQWKINDYQEIDEILSAQPNSVHNSNVFEISKLKWMARLYPNGESSGRLPAGHVGFAIKLLSLPLQWKAILIRQTLICHQTSTIFHAIKRYRARSMS